MRVTHQRHRTCGRICLELKLADAAADLLETYLTYPNATIVICTSSIQIAHPAQKLGDLGQYAPTEPGDACYERFLQFASYVKKLSEWQREPHRNSGDVPAALVCDPDAPQIAPRTPYEVVQHAVERLCGDPNQALDELANCLNIEIAAAKTASVIRCQLVTATSGYAAR